MWSVGEGTNKRNRYVQTAHMGADAVVNAGVDLGVGADADADVNVDVQVHVDVGARVQVL